MIGLQPKNDSAIFGAELKVNAVLKIWLKTSGSKNLIETLSLNWKLMRWK